MRRAEITRTTKETDITMSLEIGAKNSIFTGTSGIGFFDHMLNSFCVHGGFAINLSAKGDLQVDGHHTVEDIGIVLGQLFAKILGDRAGIARFGQSYVPMDESLARAVVDISGRPFLIYNADITSKKIGEYDSQLTKEFMRALAINMGATLHVELLYGDNEHHRTEAAYKSVARALSQAVKQTDGQILSAKGML